MIPQHALLLFVAGNCFWVSDLPINYLPLLIKISAKSLPCYTMVKLFNIIIVSKRPQELVHLKNENSLKLYRYRLKSGPV